MANRDITDYIRTFIALVGAIAVVAIAGQQVKTNFDDIKVIEQDVKTVKEVDLKAIGRDVHNLQLWQTESKGIAEGTLKTLNAIQIALENLRALSSEQKTAIALIQKDISNLEIVE